MPNSADGWADRLRLAMLTTLGCVLLLSLPAIWVAWTPAILIGVVMTGAAAGVFYCVIYAFHDLAGPQPGAGAPPGAQRLPSKLDRSKVVRSVWNRKNQKPIGEGEGIRRKTTDNVKAWEHYQEGRTWDEIWGKGANKLARDKFKKALELDPEFAAALAGLGMTYAAAARWNWRTDAADPLGLATELANRALSSNSNLADPYEVLAVVHMVKRQYDLAEKKRQKAVALEPNAAST